MPATFDLLLFALVCAKSWPVALMQTFYASLRAILSLMLSGAVLVCSNHTKQPPTTALDPSYVHCSSRCPIGAAACDDITG